jgi:HEPN domain.
MGEIDNSAQTGGLPEEAAQRILEQALDLWIKPEIDRRIAGGSIQAPFPLKAAQIVFNPGLPPEVRLNEQVKAVAAVRATRPIKSGEPVNTADFDLIARIELTEDDPDAGHISFIEHRGNWWITFSFLYNSGRIRESLAAAREFLDSAGHAMLAGHSRAFVENLHAAVELLAKAILFTTLDLNVLKMKTHAIVQSRFNLHGKHSQIDTRFPALLSRLDALRPAARYGVNPILPGESEMKELFATAQEFSSYVDSVRPRRMNK